MTRAQAGWTVREPWRLSRTGAMQCSSLRSYLAQRRISSNCELEVSLSMCTRPRVALGAETTGTRLVSSPAYTQRSAGPVLLQISSLCPSLALPFGPLSARPRPHHHDTLLADEQAGEYTQSRKARSLEMT
jgi:hypothetical protein